jgi:AAA+ ATPase superfamily predicted ATPase
MASVNTTGEKRNPFPGLRPFAAGENDFFFGREGESEEIVGKLVRNRFVAVTGASGSGKSSLIHCGVIPGIKTQSLRGTSSWRIFSIKPGNNPIGSLADAFVETNLNSGQKTVRKEEILKILKDNPDGITYILNGGAKPGGKTLLVIDQFEELFRYGAPETGRGYSREATGFINLITNAVTGNNKSFHAIIALRSDLVSECAQYKIFTQLVNNSNFLVPRMSRENFRKLSPDR